MKKILVCLLAIFLSTSAAAQMFTNIAADPATGIDYQRTPEAANAIAEDLAQSGEPLSLSEFLNLPCCLNRGAPGVVIFDYDNDGDEDLYVTNGPGGAAPLYQNQLKDSGVLEFIDVGVEAGVASIEASGAGACYGDIDNDGDEDLYVVNQGTPNHLFENQGDGSFALLADSGAEGPAGADCLSCSFGDFNNDGLLDVTVACAYPSPSIVAPQAAVPFALNVPNLLFMNQGDNHFEDTSMSSGINADPGTEPESAFYPTLVISAVDYDRDGDTDIIRGDDQAFNGPDEPNWGRRGYIRVLNNDGSGHFTDVTEAVGLQDDENIGAWMGLSFGDYNCDGHLDVFSTNVGAYLADIAWERADLGHSQWFFGTPGGRFVNPGQGDVGATHFGWGSASLDYENDGDQDIFFVGGFDSAPSIHTGNPGTLLVNQKRCSGEFLPELNAFPDVDYAKRADFALAVGDLNKDGYDDLVSVSSFNVGPNAQPRIPYAPMNSVYDGETFIPGWIPVDTAEDQEPVLVYSSVLDYLPGDMTVEINDASSGNQWVQIKTLGSVGVTDGGRANRDGIGALITVTPITRNLDQRPPVTTPVTGGSSMASQDSRIKTFGLKGARHAKVSVFWPEGLVNTFRVRAGEHLTLPELPCAGEGDPSVTKRCVAKALADLVQAELLSEADAHLLKRRYVHGGH